MEGRQADAIPGACRNAGSRPARGSRRHGMGRRVGRSATRQALRDSEGQRPVLWRGRRSWQWSELVVPRIATAISGWGAGRVMAMEARPTKIPPRARTGSERGRHPRPGGKRGRRALVRPARRTRPARGEKLEDYPLPGTAPQFTTLRLLRIAMAVCGSDFGCGPAAPASGKGRWICASRWALRRFHHSSLHRSRRRRLGGDRRRTGPFSGNCRSHPFFEARPFECQYPFRSGGQGWQRLAQHPTRLEPMGRPRNNDLRAERRAGGAHQPRSRSRRQPGRDHQWSLRGIYVSGCSRGRIWASTARELATWKMAGLFP